MDIPSCLRDSNIIILKSNRKKTKKELMIIWLKQLFCKHQLSFSHYDESYTYNQCSKCRYFSKRLSIKS